VEYPNWSHFDHGQTLAAEIWNRSGLGANTGHRIKQTVATLTVFLQEEGYINGIPDILLN